MALYLGEKKVSPVLHKEQRCAKGKIMSDENGVITFPKLDFTPKIITVWNIAMYDWTKSDDWEDGMIPYTYDGIMIFAVNHNGIWISQIPHSNSGSVTISNSSYVGDALTFESGRYCYNLTLRAGVFDDYEHSQYGMAYNTANTEFNYAIYG